MTESVIFISGITGSFGKAMLRHLLATTTATIRGMSRSELLQADLWDTLTHDEQQRVRLFIGDIRDLARLQLALRDVSMVFHGAALKRVEVGERDPSEFIRTNIYGTENIIRACIDNQVKRAVFLSSDKAVSPCNLYGMSKATAERLWIRANGYAPLGTHFTCVRYGNVTGSRGSVFETWRRCLDAGDLLSITHPEMTRFWITLPEAVALAQYAALQGPRGAILVPHLMAYQVTDLAQAFGATVVTEIGIRPGEKMHEVLIAPHESSRIMLGIHSVPDSPGYYAILPEMPTWKDTTDWSRIWEPIPFSQCYESGSWPYRMDTATLRVRLQELGVLQHKEEHA